MMRQTAFHSWGVDLRVVSQHRPRATGHRRYHSQTVGACRQILNLVLHGLDGHVMGVASQLHVNGHAIRAGIAQVSRQRACSNSLAAAQVKDKRNTVRHVQIQRHLRQCRQVGRRAGSHGSLPSVTGVRIRARASRACIQTLNLPRRAAKASRERLVGRGSSVIAVRIV